MTEDALLALPLIRSKLGYSRQGQFRTPAPRQGTHGVLSKLHKSGALSSRLEYESTDNHLVRSLPPISARGAAVDEELNDLGRLGDDDKRSPRLDGEEEGSAVRSGYASDQTMEQPFVPERTLEQIDSRKHRKICDIASAQQALRKAGHKPGDWDAKLYCRLRRNFGDEGRLDAIPGLTAIAAQASCIALDAGEYRLPSSPTEVRIPKRDHIQWLGLENVPSPPEPLHPSKVPPCVCSPLRTIDAAVKMQHLFPHHLVCASFDATDFSRDGRSLLGAVDARSSAQQEMFMRTNLDYCSRRATTFCGRRTTMKEELTAKHDPYIFVANDVVIFRGPAEDGYPFLDTPLPTMSLFVTGRAAARPHLSKKGEFFALQEDMASYIDRLNLIALGALLRGQQDSAVAGLNGAASEDSAMQESKPVLVMGLQDLTATAAQQPRHSIATAIKGWRIQYGHLFHAVILACGDESTAAILDKTVNGPLYGLALAGRLPATEWHWNMAFLHLSINGVFLNIGESVRQLKVLKARGTIAHAQGAGLLKGASRKLADDDDDSEPPSPVPRRLSAVTGAASAVAVMGENNRRASLEGEFKNGMPPVWKRSSVTAAQPEGSHAVAQPVPENADSRTAFQMCLAHRLGEYHIHDHERRHSQLEKKEMYQCPTTEEEAHAGEARAHAVSAFLGFGKHFKKQPQTKKKEEKKQNQERFRELENKARSLNMPAEIKAALHIEERVKESQGYKDDNETRERRMMEQLQSLASHVDRGLQVRQPALHVLD